MSRTKRADRSWDRWGEEPWQWTADGRTWLGRPPKWAMQRIERILRQKHRHDIDRDLKTDEEQDVVLTDWKHIKGLAGWWW